MDTNEHLPHKKGISKNQIHMDICRHAAWICAHKKIAQELLFLFNQSLIC